MRHYWDDSVKEKAKQLREKGYSFGQLTKELSVSKSTLHQWIRGIQRPSKFTALDRKRWIKEIQPLGAQGNHKKRMDKIAFIIEEAKQEIITFNVTKDVKKAMLAMLYWSEGSKGRGMLVFANTDPRIMVLFITLLRDVFKLEESKFRIRIHIHWYHKEKFVKQYWSNLLQIPLSQFEKTYHKKRSKEKTFRKNVGGICFLKYNSDYLREQIVQYMVLLGEKFTGEIVVPTA